MAHYGLMLAALLTIFLGAAHSWLGERLLIQPILSGPRAGILERSRRAPRTLRFAWHLTSLAWWGIGIMLAALAVSPLTGQGRIVLAIIATTFVLTGAIVLISSGGRHFAWPVFLGIAVLSTLPLLQLSP